MALPHTFLVLILRLIYRLVSSGEDLYREYQSYHSIAPDVPDMPLLYLMLPLIIAVPNTLIHYIMGHVLPIVSTLEHERHQVNDSEDPIIPRRSARETMRFLQASGGTGTLFRGFPIGILYHGVLYGVTFLLRVLLPSSLIPTLVVEVFARVLLSELHLTWTHATITARPTIPVPHHNLQRWKSLLIPSFVHALAKSTLHHLPEAITHSTVRLFPLDTALDHTPSNREAHIVATLQTAPLLPCLLIQFFILLPATIALTLVETSFLPKEETTIIPDARARRRARMGEFMDGHMHLVNKRGWVQGVYRFVGGETFVSVCRLHLGKCFAQWVVESVVWEVALWGWGLAV